MVKGSKTQNCENVWWGSFHVQINNNVNMQRWDPENHDSEERWPVSGLNQDESQEIWFNECLMIIRHFENCEGFWDENNHQLWYTSWHIHNILKDHSLWRKETRYCFNFITFCKEEEVHFSALTFILPSLSFLLQWAYQHFPESLNHVVFLYLIFSTRIDLFSIFFIFFRKLRVTRRIPQLLLVVQEEERGPFVFVRFVFHVWEHDFIVQLVSCYMWDFHFLFSFRWRLRQTQTSATRWIDGTWSLCKQKYFSFFFFWFDICVFIFIYLNFPM